ncbi:MAG TPA: helix-turn-helix transcriptional regulator [Candidatus Aquilonibacter sp.]|nr:helix-turn-helix transcriptional regulator [Candidatus Aquilonibacter sp.]
MDRRKDLAEFLRVRRDAITPEEAGFDAEEPRYVTGLRREEVADLAGISTTWYTWLEQAREINVSDEVLERIGLAMRMTAPEIAYMQRLVGEAPPYPYVLEPKLPPVLRKLVETYEDAPAYISTPRFDLLVWNGPMGEWFNYDAKSERLARNVLYRLFFDRARRKLYAEWEEIARRSVAAFRHNYSLYAGDKHFDELLRRMMTNKDFQRMWERHEVMLPGLPPFVLRHDRQGMLQLTTVSASLDVAHGSYLVLYEVKRLS